MAAAHRSIHPSVPGVPWWAAVVIAATATAVGFALDAGSGGKELTDVFAGLYVLGCVAAALVVRQSGIFTAVIQPPLILFFSVPGAYWLFHGAKVASIKDTIINYGYPLIERFPLMLFTSAGVLLIGMIRWYIGLMTRRAATAKAKADAAGTGAGARTGGITAKPASTRRRGPADEADGADRAPASDSRRVRAGQRAKPADPARRSRPTESPRSRQVRPPLDDTPEPGERARRRRPNRTRDTENEPPRRPRVTRDPDLRGRPPREIRRDPPMRKGRSTTRSSRFDPYEPMEPAEPLKPYEPRRRRPAPETADGTTASHHPISRVRYRGTAGNDQPREETRMRRTRTPRASDPESWEYDI